ncbi:hypothetical protein SAMN05444274_102197 [Mariniphaga anaerophila]|uniref:DUF4374 domain-containing protein n=1 Tax=Mariniphaga anaerophila TaxID=1484053 RepID=A0A1M4VST4_9BACT|nr:hypothetical protein [Mariniphaga anaerophila]SHE71988.1 hypothetical protein SAMN05444274_102197 [Mariniphaga anaerophila]
MKTHYSGLLALALVILFSSCSKNDDPTPTPEKTSNYSVLGVIDNAYYLAQAESLSEGTLSFVNNGTQLDADQAARIISAGDYLYSLDYGTGLLTQLEANSSGGYDAVNEINAGLSVGTNRPRYKLADENTIMVYNVVVEPVYNETNTDIVDNVCTLRLTSVSIPSLTISSLTEFVIPQTENAKQGATIGYHPMRVDGPVIAGNKVYFGLMHLDMSDPTTPPPFRKPKQTGLETLVFDYPSFENGTIIESDAAAGHTGGYRAPSMHVDEKGDVYQVNWFISGNSFDLSSGDKTVITRLKNGTYDASYLFNISETLGLDTNIGANGWFYVGNGIGYMPIYLEDEGAYSGANTWTVAKIDIYNKTAVKLDLPLSGLFSYENGIVADGKFYMAISPIGGESYVYEFAPESAGATGFTRGLKLDGGNVIVEGVY